MSGTIRLRRADSGDAAFFHAVRAEPSAGRFQPLRPYSEERLRKILQVRAAVPLDAQLDGKVQWVILENNRSAGWISLDVTSREHGIGAVGYTISEAFRGRGIATHALRQVVAIAFAPSQVNLERLEAVVAVQNVASQRALERVGFIREGTARGLLRIQGIRVDHYCYGLLRADHSLPGESPDHVDSARKDSSIS